MAKHSKGKHAAPAAQDKQQKKLLEAAPPAGAETGASAEGIEAEGIAADSTFAEGPVAPVPEGGAGASAHGKPAHTRTAAIAIASIVGLIALVYLIGVFVFSGRYLPGTIVAGSDFSLETPEEMAATLDETLGDYSFAVVGKGMNFTITSEEAGLSSDSMQVAADVLSEEDPWMWPIEVFRARDLTDVFTHAISANGLSDIVGEELEAVNATAKMPENATIAFDEDASSYVAVPEVKGTVIDGDKLLEAIISGLMRFDKRVVLDDAVLVEPTIFVDDPRIDEAIEQADALIAADFDLTIADNVVANVDAALSASWVSVGPELEVAFNDQALSDWATEISNACNTVGSQRSYTRPDGKAITVKGGTYGWKVDNEGLVQQVVEAVKAGSTEDIAVPVVQSGTGFSELGGQDWGSRYIDVDLTEQYARFYDGENIIWESAIVSGNPNKGNSTPQGVWSANSKQSPCTLIGTMTSEGTPEYETKVQYWMPFKGNSVGFHDATWQPTFGGSRYLTGGSHGCVNLPYKSAEALYGIIQKGDVVVVHS